MYAIQTTNLSKKYDQFFALKELNLNVKKGEVFGFIGKNGAGKTTTIYLILSLIHPTNGHISINENQVSFEDIEYKKQIGFVPDVPVFPEYMSAMEYMIYTAEIYEIKRQDLETHLKDLLEFVGLSGVEKHISNYSRGMKQRLAIAQALVHDPEILIMDEPTGALDPIGRSDVMNIILKLKGKKTVFYSTHILEDVERVCDRIGLIDNGKLLLEGAIKDIQQQYYKDRYYIESSMIREELVKLIQKEFPSVRAEVYLSGAAITLANGETSNKILEGLMKKDVEISAFYALKTSLEDVFIEVTNENTT